MAKTIRVSLNEDVERVLEQLKGQYPALDYAEILKLGLSELYWKQELASRRLWAETLPELELSNEERAALTEILSEADDKIRSDGAKVMSADEIVAEALKH